MKLNLKKEKIIYLQKAQFSEGRKKNLSDYFGPF